MNKLLLAASAFAALSVQANAATIVASFDNGQYSPEGFHNPTTTGTEAGTAGASLQERRSFFAFNLTGVDEALSASITFYGGNGFFVTDAGTETVALFDYAGAVTPLVNGTGGVPAFTDLGTGAMLGQHTIVADNFFPMPEFTVDLAPAFVAQLNAARVLPNPRIALGAALQTIDGATEEAFWFGSGVVPAAYLTITASAPVPEPATWAMMILGFGAIGTVLRRRRMKAALIEAPA